MSDHFERFKLPDGSVVGTGLLMPTLEEQRVMSAMPMFPENWIMEPKDIERALVINGAQRYISERVKRKKRMRNQGSLGKCNASSNASGVEQTREIQKMPHVALSDCFTYMQVNGGKTVDQGCQTRFKTCNQLGLHLTCCKLVG